VIQGDQAADHGTQHSEEDAGIVSQIKELLDSRVRPAVAQDGGDITFHGFERGVVYLQMKGRLCRVSILNHDAEDGH
jgi:Fe-S cluster biogenesis protein NfuA